MRMMYEDNEGASFIDEVATMNLSKYYTFENTDEVIGGLFIESTDMNENEVLIIFNPNDYVAVMSYFKNSFYGQGILDIDAIGVDYYVVFNPESGEYDDIKRYTEELCNS